jgi:hypothetical protein
MTIQPKHQAFRMDRSGDTNLCLLPKSRNEGLIRPYRPKPKCFRETYVMMGWDGIEEHYRTNWRVIRRWIIQEGREELAAERAAYVRQNGRRVR